MHCKYLTTQEPLSKELWDQTLVYGPFLKIKNVLANAIIIGKGTSHRLGGCPFLITGSLLLLTF